MIINATLKTDGSSIWSGEIREVSCDRMTIRVMQEDYGELRVFFNTEDWNIREHGLIYTDHGWLSQLKQYLVENLGFTPEGVSQITYSEQGMQDERYVSLDVLGSLFIKEYFTALYTPRILDNN